MPTPPELGHPEFEWLRNAIYERAGISLSSAKRDLIESRLGLRVLEMNLSGFPEYIRFLKDLPQDHVEWQGFINSLTTNKTSWFRESKHFDHLASLAEGAKHDLRVWCAASSTGEEPYTIAAVLTRFAPKREGFSIVATDIDTHVLEVATRGVYPKSGVADIPEEYRKGNFAMGTGEISEWMKVSSSLREKVEFGQQNLIEHPFPWKKSFDVIFCRNVFIYFDKPTIERAVNAFAETAKSGAYLYLGHAETLTGLRTPWKSVEPAVYRLP